MHCIQHVRRKVLMQADFLRLIRGNFLHAKHVFIKLLHSITEQIMQVAEW
jgi:hypothetical protein